MSKRCRIGVVAPASRMSPEVAEKVPALAAGRYPDRTPDDETRARAFLDVANDESFDAVWFARGSYGSCRVVAARRCRLTTVAQGIARWPACRRELVLTKQQGAMRAYHNDPQIKADILVQLATHREADQLIKKWVWRDGKGCAVGCTIHSIDHAEYETRFGIPQMLARLEDCIFIGLPNEQAMAWPERFMGAIVPGSDLSRVGWQFLHWLLTESGIGALTDPHVSDAVKQCADVLMPLKDGRPTDESAADAAWRAASTAWSTAGAVESLESAADSAESAARSAADSAVHAEDSAESAAASAEDSAARSAAYIAMSNKLIALIIEAGEHAKSNLSEFRP